jgi:glycosyltransferase involved in cell wall biosynthesis
MKRKNQGFLMQTFLNEDFEQDVFLILVGHGSERERLKQAFQSHPKFKQLIFIDSLTNEQVSTLMNKSIAVIYPSIDEGFGMPIIEASIICKKIIIPEIPVFFELKNAFTVFYKPQDSIDLASKMKLILEEFNSNKTDTLGFEYQLEHSLNDLIHVYNDFST